MTKNTKMANNTGSEQAKNIAKSLPCPEGGRDVKCGSGNECTAMLKGASVDVVLDEVIKI